ncbi:MAG: prolipoprotein diacylglyceryl transferase, partial [Syntrophales bacterium]|nr:prolipoprotein diacylglyceryl transferase [Syntrophales bacterium]
MENWIAAWRNIPAHLRPYLFEIGSFQLRWYSLMYLAAFACIYLLVMRRIRRENFPYAAELIQDFFVWAILGVILGGRLGYVFFYNLGYYLRHPLEILFPFEFNGGLHFVGISGMSYHGGAIAVLIATLIFCRKRGIDFWRFADLFSSAIPLGYTFGRIGNFINGELYGRATDVPWGMLFPLDPKHLLRHPSQLYEAFFEGIVLFAVLWTVRKKFSTTGALFAFYIMGYGVVRFFIEFFREPDVQLGFVLGPFSMGQLLCLLMILAGAAIYALR